MKNLSIERMESVEGGDSNLGNAVCALSTAAWALGAISAPTGFGAVLWGVGAIGVIYCNSQMAS